MEYLTLTDTDLQEGSLTFIEVDSQEEPIIKLCLNGDIYVKGKLVENDKEVVDGLREFLKKANQI